MVVWSYGCMMDWFFRSIGCIADRWMNGWIDGGMDGFLDWLYHLLIDCFIGCSTGWLIGNLIFRMVEKLGVLSESHVYVNSQTFGLEHCDRKSWNEKIFWTLQSIWQWPDLLTTKLDGVIYTSRVIYKCKTFWSVQFVLQKFHSIMFQKPFNICFSIFVTHARHSWATIQTDGVSQISDQREKTDLKWNHRRKGRWNAL